MQSCFRIFFFLAQFRYIFKIIVQSILVTFSVSLSPSYKRSFSVVDGPTV